MNEIVVARVVLIGTIHPRSGHAVHPQRLHPGVADVARIGRSRHARLRALNAAAIPAGQKLPLLQREVRQLIDADKKIFRALVAVHIVFVVAVGKPRRRAVKPRDDMLGFVVFVVQLARHIAPKISDQRSFQLRIRPPHQQRVHAGMLVCLVNRFIQQRLGFSRPRRSAEEPIFCARIVKFLLARKWLVKILNFVRAFPRLRFVCSNPHGSVNHGCTQMGTDKDNCHPILSDDFLLGFIRVHLCSSVCIRG